MHYGYLLRGQITGLYKVGITNNVARRISNYRVHIPERVIQEGVKEFLSKEEAEDWERLILDFHSDKIHHGEWLDITFEEAVYIWGASGKSALWHCGGEFYVTYRPDGFSASPSLTRVFTCDNCETAKLLMDALDRKFGWSAKRLPATFTAEVVASELAKEEARWLLIRKQYEEIDFRSNALADAGVEFPEGWDGKLRMDKLEWLNVNHPVPIGQRHVS